MRRSLTALMLLILIAPATQAAWPTEGGTPANLGTSSIAPPGQLNDPRAFDIGAKGVAQVTEGPAGLALLGTIDGKLRAIDALGRTAWTVDTAGPMRSAPLWTGDLVVALPRADRAVALDATGKTAWTVPTGNDRDIPLVRMASPVQHPSGDIILVDLEAKVQRVTPEGEVVWARDLGKGLSIHGTPTITPQGDVIVTAFTPGTEDQGKIHRLAGGTGASQWERQLGSQVVAAATITGDTILVPLRDGDALQARSLANGRVSWEVGFDDHLTASPSVHQGTAVVGDIRGVLRGIGVGSGDIVWEFNPIGDVVTGGAPLSIADAAAIDARGRAWVGYWAVDMTTCCPPTGSEQSPFYLIDVETGERLAKTTLPQASHGPSIHATGTWSMSDDGELRRWPTRPTVQAHATVQGTQVTLLANSDATGPWEIDWGAESQQATGRIPLVSTQALDPGEHTIRVKTQAGTTQVTVTVDVDPASGPPDDGTDDQADPGNNTTGNGAPDDGEPSSLIPVAPVTALLAMVLAAWRRRRG